MHRVRAAVLAALAAASSTLVGLAHGSGWSIFGAVGVAVAGGMAAYSALAPDIKKIW
jgi:hypothetical protein